MLDFLNRTFYHNTLRAWLIAIGIVLVAYGILHLLRRFLRREVGALAQRTRNQMDDVAASALRETRGFFLVALSLYAGSRAVVLPADSRALWVLRLILVAATMVQAGIWGNEIIATLLKRHTEIRTEEDAASVTTLNALGIVGRIALWSVLVLVGLDNMGIKVTTLVTGLGIGGVAVALAVQNVLKDLFASLSIVLDKPFVLGDFIIVGDMMGTVEHIGLKTTRLRSLSGEQLVFSNTDLLDSRIRNYKRMFERRILFTVGVLYETSREHLELIPRIIREAVEAQADTRFDRSHFKGFGAFSLDFETVYYVLSPDYNKYMDIQQAINLILYSRFQEEGIGFAYPTQTLYLERGTAAASAGQK